MKIQYEMIGEWREMDVDGDVIVFLPEEGKYQRLVKVTNEGVIEDITCEDDVVASKSIMHEELLPFPDMG